MSKGTSIVLAFLGGAAVGATMGLLYAPEKGEVLRKRISSRTRELYDKVEEMLRRRGIHLSKEEINALVDDIKQDVQMGEDV